MYLHLGQFIRVEIQKVWRYKECAAVCCSVVQCGAVCCSVWQFLAMIQVQPNPLGVTFSKAVSKLKAPSSNVSFATFQCKETFELSALSFERAFENVTPRGIGCTFILCDAYESRHKEYVAVCCSVLQCVAVCCSVL